MIWYDIHIFGNNFFDLLVGAVVGIAKNNYTYTPEDW